MIAELAATVAFLTAPPIKTIVHARSSPLCNEYRSLVVPLARVQQRNIVLMRTIHNESLAYRKYEDSIFRNGMTLHAAQIDAAATTILQNLAPMNDLLAQSWKRSPAGNNPKVDQLRRRVQNVVDLQRAIADQEVQFGGYAVDNDGMDLLAAASAASFGAPPQLAGATPTAPPGAIEIAANASPRPLPEDDPRIPSATPADLNAKHLASASAASLQMLLADESALLAPIASTLADDCGGVPKTP